MKRFSQFLALASGSMLPSETCLGGLEMSPGRRGMHGAAASEASGPALGPLPRLSTTSPR